MSEKLSADTRSLPLTPNAAEETGSLPPESEESSRFSPSLVSRDYGPADTITGQISVKSQVCRFTDISKRPADLNYLNYYF